MAGNVSKQVYELLPLAAVARPSAVPARHSVISPRRVALGGIAIHYLWSMPSDAGLRVDSQHRLTRTTTTFSHGSLPARLALLCAYGVVANVLTLFFI